MTKKNLTLDLLILAVLAAGGAGRASAQVNTGVAGAVPEVPGRPMTLEGVVPGGAGNAGPAGVTLSQPSLGVSVLPVAGAGDVKPAKAVEYRGASFSVVRMDWTALAKAVAAAGAVHPAIAAADGEVAGGEPGSDIYARGIVSSKKDGQGGDDGGDGGGGKPVSKAALQQLKDELKALKGERSTALAMAASADAVSHEYPAGAAEVRGRAYERAGDLQGRIDVKQKEIEAQEAARRNAGLARYGELHKDLVTLKTERNISLLVADMSGTTGHDFKGGAGEARARALEQADALKARIQAKQAEIAALKDEHSPWLGIHYRLASAWKDVRRYFGSSDSPEYNKLKAEIGALQDQRLAAMALAADPSIMAHEYSLGAAEVRARALETARDLTRRIEEKRAQLAKL